MVQEMIKNEPNVRIKSYVTYVPSNRNHSFTKLLNNLIRTYLNQNKIVIIGNHTSADNFGHFLPTISELFSHFKFLEPLNKDQRKNLFMFSSGETWTFYHKEPINDILIVNSQGIIRTYNPSAQRFPVAPLIQLRNIFATEIGSNYLNSVHLKPSIN